MLFAGVAARPDDPWELSSDDSPERRLKLASARHHVETIVGLGYRFVSAPGQSVSAH